MSQHFNVSMQCATAMTLATLLTACGGGGGDSGSPSSGNNTTGGTTENTPLVLNDTGITLCTNGTVKNLNCATANLGSWVGLNQDGEVGRDALATKALLSKTGTGIGGFDYTKISSSGSKLAANVAQWSCVLDNRTGLMWEVKTDDGSLRDKDNTYLWFNSNSSTNGGNAGSNASSNTESYIQAVNATSLCSYSNWRLPTRMELVNLVNYGGANISIDLDFFPNTVALDYWTSSTADDGTKAWYVAFDGKTTKYNNKTSSHYVRLVRTQ